VLNDGTVLCSFNARRNAAGAFTQSSGVFIYNPGLQTWSDKSDSHLFYWTQDVVVDPNDPLQNTWYAGAYNGWGGPPNGLGGLYKTTDRGNSWTRLSSMEGVTSVTFNPGNPDQLFVATEIDGLLSSTDINSVAPTFQSVTGYPFRQPHRIFFNPYNSNEVWISSFGNGMKVGDMTSMQVANNSPVHERLEVYPNPSVKKSILNCPESSVGGSLKVISSFGKEIYSDILTKRQIILNTENWLPGVYFIIVSKPGKEYREKLVIE